MKTPHDLWLVVAAVVAMGVGGLFAAIDAAVSTVSAARVEDLVKDRRAGAARLEKILEARGVYVGLAVLLRVDWENRQLMRGAKL